MTPFVNVLWPTEPSEPEPDFPVVAGTASSSEDTDTTSHAVTLPTGTVSGDLIVIAFQHSSVNVGSLTVPSGWTVLDTNSQARLITGVATNSDPVIVTTDVLRRSTHVTFRITNTTNDVEGSLSDAAPPLRTPSWGSAKTLWLATVGTRIGGGNEWTQPADYTGLVQIGNAGANTTSTSYCRVAMAYRELEAASEQPGAWSNAGNTDNVRWGTIAVRPS